MLFVVYYHSLSDAMMCVFAVSVLLQAATMYSGAVVLYWYLWVGPYSRDIGMCWSA